VLSPNGSLMLSNVATVLPRNAVGVSSCQSFSDSKQICCNFYIFYSVPCGTVKLRYTNTF
jgi:hypothetical protein